MIKGAILILLKIYFRLEYLFEALFSHLILKLKGSNFNKRIKYKSDFNDLIESIKNRQKKRLALFVAYHDSCSIPKSNIEYLKILLSCDFKVVYIHNGKLDIEPRKKLENIGCFLICRENIGQDFGAWKDTFAFLEKNNIIKFLDWVLICNDSNFCLNGTNQKFITTFERCLSNPKDIDFIALNCNLERQLHYQSYFICFGKEILLSNSFKKFWENYLPLNHRYHAINKGEMKLTQKVLVHYRPEVILNNYKIYWKICSQINKKDIHELISFFPKNYTSLEKCFDNSNLRNGLKKLIGLLESYNPSHVFALVNVKYLDSPFLKKDIVRNGLYSLSQVYDLLIALNLDNDPKLLKEIMELYSKKGTIYSYISERRKKYRLGIPNFKQIPYSWQNESKILLK